MKAFKHINATSVDEAITLMHSFGGSASLMAGGTDLLGVLKDEILPDYPEIVINIKTITGLDQIDFQSYQKQRKPWPRLKSATWRPWGGICARIQDAGTIDILIMWGAESSAIVREKVPARP